MIRRRPCFYQAFGGRRFVERCEKRGDGVVTQMPVTPLLNAHAIVAMVFHLLHGVGIERLGVARRAEGAVIHVASCATGNLADFLWPQMPYCYAVEFFHGGESNMIDIH